MIFSNPIVISQKIQYNKTKSFAASFGIHATFLAILFYIATLNTVPLTHGEERVVISLSDFSSTDGDINKLEQLPQPKKTLQSIPKVQPKTVEEIEPLPITTTPERIVPKQPTLSSEASAPLAIPQSRPSSPPPNSIDSPKPSTVSSEKELPKNPVSDNQIGGAAFGHIKAMIENAITYPAIARKLRLEGVVTILFTLNGDGTIEMAKITATSGSHILDKKALDTILSLSGDYPKLGKPIDFNIPIAFNLHKS